MIMLLFVLLAIDRSAQKGDLAYIPFVYDRQLTLRKLLTSSKLFKTKKRQV